MPKKKYENQRNVHAESKEGRPTHISENSNFTHSKIVADGRLLGIT